MGFAYTDVPLEVYLLAMIVVIIVFIIVVITLTVKLSKLRKNYLAVINGGSAEDLEKLLTRVQTKLIGLDDQRAVQQNKIEQMQMQLDQMKGDVVLSRYNAYGEGGSDLSFSIAIVDKQKDGIVLTGIHNRDQMYMYAKPLQKGESAYPLTPEEKDVIARSGEKK